MAAVVKPKAPPASRKLVMTQLDGWGRLEWRNDVRLAVAARPVTNREQEVGKTPEESEERESNIATDNAKAREKKELGGI